MALYEFIDRILTALVSYFAIDKERSTPVTESSPEASCTEDLSPPTDQIIEVC